jgi:hypothetical protein
MILRNKPFLVVFFLFIISLLASCFILFCYLDKPLLGPHSFRQTQTAVSAFYMSENPRIFLDYTTPILGKPWCLPLEVPLFQWIAARVFNLFGFTMDQSGKIVSITFWLLCIPIIYLLLEKLGFNKTQVLLCLTIVFSSPLYLFWSNAFLMETMCLFLGALMVLSIFLFCNTTFIPWLFLAFFSGALCILCKGTTWAISVGLSFLLMAYSFLSSYFSNKNNTGKSLIKSKQNFIKIRAVYLLTPLIFILQYVVGKVWISYGDSIKVKNPFARQVLLTNSDQGSAWYFGTLAQKLDPETWKQIWQHVSEQICVPIPIFGPFFIPFVIILGMVMSPKKIPLIAIFFFAFVSGPFVFTNLYYEHSYYWTANGLWLLLATGIAIAGIWESHLGKHWPRMIALTATALISFSGFSVWYNNFKPVLKSLPTREQILQVWTEPIQKIVPKERTLLIVGHGWNPNALYYANRKGIAFPFSGGLVQIPFPGPQLFESISQLDSNEKLGAIVMSESCINDIGSSLPATLDSLGMLPNGIRTPFGILFPAKDLPSSSTFQ